MLLFLSPASSYEIRLERTRTRLREIVGNDSSTVDRDHMIVDSDVIEGDLNSPLPAGQKETIVIRVKLPFPVVVRREGNPHRRSN